MGAGCEQICLQTQKRKYLKGDQSNNSKFFSFAGTADHSKLQDPNIITFDRQPLSKPNDQEQGIYIKKNNTWILIQQNTDNIYSQSITQCKIVSQSSRYQGKIENGKYSGHGKLLLYDQSVFQGTFFKGLKVNGIQKFVNNNKFEGDFDQNQNFKEGLFVWKDGTGYEGPFNERGMIEGYGQMSFSDGRFYKGNFKNERFEDYGVMTYADGSRYAGMFKEGLKHGKGVFEWSKDKKFEGEFVKGQMQGKGIIRQYLGLRQIVREVQYQNGRLKKRVLNK